MLYLQELAKQGAKRHEQINVSERLPSFISEPCQIDVTYQVEAKDDFHLIHLEIKGELNIACQRCMHEFKLSYNNPTVVAVARSDERAERLLEEYECIVSSNWQVSLEDLVADDLHLYVPQFHQEISDCDEEINRFLTGKIESY